MTSLSFPDVNVWLALLLADHVHREAAKRWWDAEESDAIGFSRLTQMSVLRLLTTSAAMNGRPLTMRRAWTVYDRLFEDDRVCFLPEPNSLDAQFRTLTSARLASPKVWADAYLIAFADAAGATLVSFDRALASRARNALALA